ncbi:MAG: hypothetical protein H8E87_01460 [FCB group bacterium]|nr:hypothetical protein [FCB group bacterium]
MITCPNRRAAQSGDSLCRIGTSFNILFQSVISSVIRITGITTITRTRPCGSGKTGGAALIEMDFQHAISHALSECGSVSFINGK